MSVPFADLPQQHYGCILADPPWHFRARTALQVGNWTSRRDAEKHYNVMGVDDIAALPVKDIAAKDAHLFIWTTGPCLRQTFEVMEAWGFRYSRSFDVRQLRVLPTLESDLHVGLGLTTRKNAEFCLLGRRGNAHRNAKDVREIIMSRVREHSRKPDEARVRIERYCDGPYIELFARSQREGWDSWGNETAKFEAAA
jgi:N6-adenosine-specific RNA methylase IME4